MRDELAREIVALAVASHRRLAAFLGPDLADESKTLDWLDEQATQMAKLLYAEQSHWHHWTGRCIGEVPFELYVYAVGVFGTVWFYDIMLRKARDRGLPEAAMRTEGLRDILFAALDQAHFEVEQTRDREAEARHKRDGRRTGRVAHWLNRLRWGH